MSRFLFPNVQRGSANLHHLGCQRTVQAEVVLGNPHHNCAFHGICRIAHDLPFRTNFCAGTRVQGWLMRPSPGHAVLLIPQGQLPAELEAYHFNRPELECQRRQAVFGRDRRGRRQYLQAGQIPVRRSGEYYRLDFLVGN